MTLKSAVCRHRHCSRGVYRRQLCTGHYRQLMGYRCTIPGCDRQIYKRKVCNAHLTNPAQIKPEKPLTRAEQQIDLDDFWDWVKIELGLESNKKITTEKTAHKP